MNRLAKVQQLVRDNQLRALIIDNPIDLYYLTGQEVSLGRLVVTDKEASFFLDGRYFEACQNLDSIKTVLTMGYGKESAFFKNWAFARMRVGFDADATTY